MLVFKGSGLDTSSQEESGDIGGVIYTQVILHNLNRNQLKQLRNPTLNMQNFPSVHIDKSKGYKWPILNTAHNVKMGLHF